MDAIKFEQLHVFIEVVEKGSFAAVAQTRGVNPSSISRSIQSLEQSLNAKLFQRSTRHLFLTETGEIYYDSIKPLLGQFANAHQKAQDIQSALKGKIKMTLPPGFAEHLVLPVLSEFMTLHPELQLDLVITDACLDLEKERIDLGIRIGQVDEESWIAKPLRHFAMKLCALPDLAQSLADVPFRQLCAQRFIGFMVHETWQLRHKSTQELTAIEFIPAVSSSSIDAVYRLCLQGNGLAILPDWLVDEDLATGRLVQVFADYEIVMQGAPFQTWLIFPSKEYLPKKTRLLLDFLYSKLKDSNFSS